MNNEIEELKEEITELKKINKELYAVINELENKHLRMLKAETADLVDTALLN